MGYKVILDNGHGGMINGEYQTPGKRSPKWDTGVLYEGMFNRWVVNRIIENLDRLKIPYYHVSPELTDVTLKTRVERANKIYKADKKSYLLSIHANAGGGKGVEGFTSIGRTFSDYVGEKFLKNIEEDLADQRMRFDYSDGDRDKEANYYVLRNTSCPAFLLEAGFMDTESDYANLWSPEYLQKIVDSCVRSIKELYELESL